MDSLLDPGDLRVVEDAAGSGCTLACSRAFKRGELLFRSAPFGVAIAHKFALRWCSFCLSFQDEDKAFPIRCDTCRHAHYCSESCRAAHAEPHGAQCRTLTAIIKAGLKEDVEILAVWLADAWASRAPTSTEARGMDALRHKWASSCKPCTLLRGPSGRCPGACRRAALARCEAEKSTADAEGGPPAPSTEHLLALCRDLPDYAGYADRAKLYKEASTVFADLWAAANRSKAKKEEAARPARGQGRRKAGVKTAAPGCAAAGDAEVEDQGLPAAPAVEVEAPQREERPQADQMEEWLARGQRNEFGIFDMEGEEHGKVQFPAVAMINSSCLPNVVVRIEGRAMYVYALRSLAAGTRLCVSYGNLSLKLKERRWNMSQSWGFDCMCGRCLGREKEAAAFDAEHLCTCGGVRVPDVMADGEQDNVKASKAADAGETVAMVAPKARSAFALLADSDESDEEDDGE